MINTTVERLVGFCARRAWLVVLGAVILAAAAAGLTATRLTMNTDVDVLMAETLHWRQKEIAYDRLFPLYVNILAVVVDGRNPELADRAAATLTDRLANRPDLFKSVRRPDAGPFFDKNGILFLSVEEIRKITEQLVEAQPLLGSLAADPSARGLFQTLDLVFEGIRRGQADIAMLAAPLDAIASTVRAAMDGRSEPLSWGGLLTGRPPSPEELRRFILVQPVLDFSDLKAGAAPSDFVRDAARELDLTPEHGVTVRLTGSVALNDDEFASISQGAGTSLALSCVLVLGLLFLAVRSWRLIVPIVATLTIGLLATAGFATLAIGSLNPISVAFAVMFVGIAVDFSIQVCVRYREQRYRIPEPMPAMRATGREISRPLLLSAATTAAGFLAFVPTAYVGVSQLGIIAGAGMLIAVALNLTVLPALLTLMRPAPEREPIGFKPAEALDRWLLRHSRGMRWAALGLGLVALALLPRLGFDFNPLNLKDPTTESMATLTDLMASNLTTPFTINVVTPSVADAAALNDRLSKLPEVAMAIDATSFVPEDQPAKLALIADAAMLVGPGLTPPRMAPPPDVGEIRAAVAAAADELSGLVETGKAPGRAALVSLLRDLAKAEDPIVWLAADALLDSFPDRLRNLGQMLEAGPVTLDTLPADLKRDWIAPDGQARVEAHPAGDTRDNDTLIRFVASVRAIAPDATGAAIGMQESAQTITDAFVRAGILALVAITLLLGLALRRALDVALVVGPLILAGLVTLATCALIGLPLNFANVIALPLLLGIGVAFNVYFVVNWRSGKAYPLSSPTARAVFFSALTTSSAFGTLAVSSHPGTASMGVLLTISLIATLAITLFTLPAFLGPVSRRERGRSRE